MTNTEIIAQAVEMTFSPEQIETLNNSIFTPAQLAKRQAAGMEPAEIAGSAFHTFAEWKRLGYSVKKGQHAALIANLWKYTDKPGTAAKQAAAEAGKDEPENDPHFYRTKAHLFNFLQVEKTK